MTASAWFCLQDNSALHSKPPLPATRWRGILCILEIMRSCRNIFVKRLDKTKLVKYTNNVKFRCAHLGKLTK